MSRCLYVLLLLIGSSLLPAPVRAQSSTPEDTRARLEALKEQIQADERRLAQANREKQASLETLESLDRQIALRKELVESYQQRLAQLNRSEDSLQTSLAALQSQLAALRENYQELATHAYMYGRLYDVALILAAESINEMLMRVRYLHRFTEQRRERLEALQAAGAKVREQRSQLAAQRERTVELLREAQRERQNLTNLQRSRRQVVQELRAQSQSIEHALSQQRPAAQQLEARIRRLMAAERARRRARTAGASPAERAAERARFEALTGSFRDNRGNLPWPVQGAVVEPFGMIVNPVHGTKTPNPGITIATSPQAGVRAVFEGEVINIDAMPDYGTLVAVRHGDYLTLYSNFSMVYVSEGDYVEAGELIGRAGTEAEPRGAGIFFALFHDGQAVNPASWLRDR